MTSQLNVDTIVDKAGSGGTNVKIANNAVAVSEGGSGTTNIVQGLNKQWVRTSGAAVTVADSFNTASVTDSGTGLYAPQFTTNMGNTNYAVLSSSDDKQDGGSIFVHNINDAVAQATSGYGTSNKKYSYALADGNQNIASAALGDLA
jgi:alpha-acetolactate decarboxylase